MLRKLAACRWMLFLLVAACAGVEDARPPQVSVADLRLAQGGLLEQQFDLLLRVGNPNNYDLPLEGMTFRLDLNDRPFLEGQSNQRVTVPRLGEAMVTVRGTATLLDIVQQAMALTQASEFTYRLEGVAYLAGLRSRSVPYERQGGLRLLPGQARRFEPLR